MSKNNLAALLKTSGRYKEAEPLLREAHQGCVTALGKQHVETLRASNNLAALLKDRGEYDKAETLFKEAFVGCREKYGVRHPNTIRFAQNLASVLKAQGRLNEKDSYGLKDVLEQRVAKPPGISAC
mmetsp:Transcript_147113/g.255421  ORF Transcript_147113/g.255421 Transcript_147113/m.255421 type:complete len:126 (+) Transcript_147113:850-1227(+)